MKTDSTPVEVNTADPNISTKPTDRRIASWLRLRHCHGIGNRTALDLLNAFPSVESIFDASQAQLRAAGLNHKQIESLSNTGEDAIASDLEWLEQEDHHVITRHDTGFPQAIHRLDDSPILLYVRGDPDYLDQPQLAMVGSRNPTAAGRSIATDFARHLSQNGITITSGLAAGIDGAAHQGALEGIAGTVAIVAHGLDIVYPAQHQKLAQQICEHGAIISEMPVGTTPQPGLFPRRNRLISGISLGTLIVEAAIRSGSLITARNAMEQNREVFAIPGSIYNPMARGCHQLIRQGAKLVETAEDILEEISASLPHRPQNNRHAGQDDERISQASGRGAASESKPELDPDHQKLLKCLGYEPASIDELVENSGFSAAEIASMLLIMELQGTVVCQDGRYTRVE